MFKLNLMLFFFQPCIEGSRCVLSGSCNTASHIPSFYEKLGQICENNLEKCCDIRDIVKQQPAVSTNTGSNVRYICRVQI